MWESKNFLIICTETEEAKRAVSIAEKDPMFDVACGFYPNDILKVTDKDWQELEELVRHPAVKAVGEIRMDYFPYETVVPAGLRKEAFVRHDAAGRAGKGDRICSSYAPRNGGYQNVTCASI